MPYFPSERCILVLDCIHIVLGNLGNKNGRANGNSNAGDVNGNGNGNGEVLLSDHIALQSNKVGSFLSKLFSIQ